MDSRGYVTMMDALIFLVMISACALILSPAITSSDRQRAMTDAGLRDMASSTLLSMEAVKADYFEYCILGDVCDDIARASGVDPGSRLYSDTAKAVLGRGSRHKTIMDIAAENAACQFTLRYDERTLKLNQLTGDYDSAASEYIESYLRNALDDRYSYGFTLRWVPFVGVPFEGMVIAGKAPPQGATSAGVYVTMPYTTHINQDSIRALIAPELENIQNSIEVYRADGDEERMRMQIRTSLGTGLEKTVGYAVDEVWNNTIMRTGMPGNAHDPLSLLENFSGRNVQDRTFAYDVRDALYSMVIAYNASLLDELAEEVTIEICEGSMDDDAASDLIVSWMRARYNPSRGRASLSIWVDPHAV